MCQAGHYHGEYFLLEQIVKQQQQRNNQADLSRRQCPANEKVSAPGRSSRPAGRAPGHPDTEAPRHASRQFSALLSCRRHATAGSDNWDRRKRPRQIEFKTEITGSLAVSISSLQHANCLRKVQRPGHALPHLCQPGTALPLQSQSMPNNRR